MNSPSKAPLPGTLRPIGPTERHFLIVGHVIYAVVVSFFVMITNTVLSGLANVREFCSTIMDTPFNANTQIDAQNDLWFLKQDEEDEITAEVEAEKPTEKDE